MHGGCGPRSRRLLLLAAAALGVMRLRETTPVAQEVRSQIPQPEGLTFNPGTQAAISPDGRWLAFPALGPDNVSRMYVRSIDSLEVRPLPGSEGIIGLSPPPFWSYDSRFVVYGALGKLKKSEVTGTPAQTIADTGAPVRAGRDLESRWRDPVREEQRHSGAGFIERRNSGRGDDAGARRSSSSLAAVSARWPALPVPAGVDSPEKTGIYVGSLDVKPEEQSLQPLLLTNRQAWWVASESSGESYLLMQREEALLAQPFDTSTATLSGAPIAVANGVGAFAPATSGLWSVARNGALVYRAGGTGLPQLTWVDPTGRSVSTVGERGLYAGIAVIPGRAADSLGLADAQGNRDIWVRDVARGGNTKLTFDPRPDNPRVVSGRHEDRVRGQPGRQPRPLREERGRQRRGAPAGVIRSGQDPDQLVARWPVPVVHVPGPKTQDDLWILPLDGERKPFVFLNTEAQEIWVSSLRISGGLPITRRPPGSRGFRAPILARLPFGGRRHRGPVDDLDKRRYVSSMERRREAALLRHAEQRLDGCGRSGRNQFRIRCPQRLFGNAPGPWGLSPAGDRFLFPRTPQRRSAAAVHDGAELDGEAGAVRVTTHVPS